jgi:FKBP-type peptidyl-prolyl cis-trans isomerase
MGEEPQLPIQQTHHDARSSPLIRPFANSFDRCENTSMKKTLTIAVTLFAACTMFAGITWAQDAPASQPPATPAAKPSQSSASSAAKTQHPPVKKTPPVLVLKTPKDKASYAIGMNMGENLHKASVDVDANIIARGLKDALAGGKTLLTDDEAKTAMTALQADVRKKQEDKMQLAGGANKQAGDAFLAANKSKESVVTLPSGLQYKILTEGTGPKPTASDSVVCNYRGTLIDGKEFDSSYQRGQPATFPVGQVIKGWTEALQLMPVGSKWQLFIPSELAYGSRGAGADIGPNSTLIFEVELISIKDKGK